MSLPTPINEETLRGLVDATIVHNNALAFKHLEDQSKDPQIFLKHVAPVIWHYISPAPPEIQTEGRPLTTADIMILIALDVLTSKKQYGDRGFMKDLRKYTLNIVRWVHYFNIQWLLYGDPSLDEPTGVYQGDVWASLLDVLPHCIVILTNAGDDKILSLMRADSSVGSTLSALCLSSFRARKSNTALKEAAFYSHILLSGENNNGFKPWQKEFHASIIDVDAGFMDYTMAFLDECLDETLSIVVKNMMTIGPFLMRCISSGFQPLFSILMQRGLIRRISKIANRISASLKRLAQQRVDATDSLSVSAQLLSLSFPKGGVGIISEALRNRLLFTTIDIHHFTGPQTPQPRYKPLHGFFAQVLDAIARLVVYRKIYHGCKMPGMFLLPVMKDHRKTRDPSPICKAFVHLAVKLLSEADIQMEIGRDLEHKRQGSSGLDYYNICDNVDCSRIGKEHEFGFCAGCRTGLYCSRRCQRARWKAGHREECKILGENKYNQQNSITPFHDEEYFRRTAITRYRFYRRRSKPRFTAESKNSLVHLDLAKHPFEEYTAITSEKIGARRRTNGSSILKVTYPVCDDRGTISFEFPLNDVPESDPEEEVEEVDDSDSLNSIASMLLA